MSLRLVSALLLSTALSVPALADGFKVPEVAAIDRIAAQGDPVGAVTALIAAMNRQSAEGLLEIGKLWRIGLREAPPLRHRRPDRAIAALRKAAAIPGESQGQALYNLARLIPEQATAEKLYDQAVTLAYPPALRRRGTILALVGTPESDAKAALFLRLAAGKGDAKAMLSLADLIADGRATGDPGTLQRQGLALLEAAAAAGESSAMADLAEIAQNRGDPATALMWLRRASGARHTGATLDLGNAAENLGDIEQAAVHYRYAAELGSAAGATALAELGLFGDQEIVPEAEVRRWLDLAVSVDHVPAIVLAARIARNEGDPAKAEALLGRMRGTDFLSASDALALANAFGGSDAIISDTSRAQALYEQALAAGSATARVDFATFLLWKSEPEDTPRAIALLEQAADAGNATAMIALGDVFARSGTPDRATAQQYYARAVDAGSTSAKDRLASLLYASNISPAARAEAIDLWRSAASTGHVSAMTKLGRALLAEAGGLETASSEVLEEAVSLIEDAARHGNASAMAELADILTSNALGQPRIDLARDWLRQSADAGRTSSLVTLARTYITTGEADRAVTIFEEAAERGSVHSMVELARAFTLGVGVAPSIERGNAWLQRADAAGVADPRTLEIIGRGYLEAANTPDGTKRAVELLTRAADAGNVRSMMTLARAYNRGEVLDADPEAALGWFRRAADSGNVTAMVEIGKAYGTGTGVAEDGAEAVRWLDRAVAAGSRNTSALIALGDAFNNGIGVERDTHKGFIYYEQAARQGSTRAMERVAIAYQSGIGVPQSPADAVPWFKRAASQGSVTAMVELGRIYASGYGTSVDPEQAFQYFREAAASGSGHAMREVGRFLLSGYGLASDPNEALVWFTRATEQGEVGAMVELAVIYSNGFAIAPEPSKAVAWLERAVSAGSIDAKQLLGVALMEGRGTQMDRERGIRLLEEAADAGDNQAARYLRQTLAQN